MPKLLPGIYAYHVQNSHLIPLLLLVNHDFFGSTGARLASSYGGGGERRSFAGTWRTEGSLSLSDELDEEEQDESESESESSTILFFSDTLCCCCCWLTVTGTVEDVLVLRSAVSTSILTG